MCTNKYPNKAAADVSTMTICQMPHTSDTGFCRLHRNFTKKSVPGMLRQFISFVPYHSLERFLYFALSDLKIKNYFSRFLSQSTPPEA